MVQNRYVFSFLALSLSLALALFFQNCGKLESGLVGSSATLSSESSPRFPLGKGSFAFQKGGEGPGHSSAQAVATDFQGNLIVVSTQSYVNNVTEAANVKKLNSKGTVLWSTELSGFRAYIYIDSVAVDSKGNVYVSGGLTAYQNVSKGLDGLPLLLSYPQIFLAVFDQNGNKISISQVPTGTRRSWVAVDRLDRVIWTANAYASVDGQPYVEGNYSFVFMNLDISSKSRTTHQYNFGNMRLSSVNLGLDGNIFAVGSTKSSFDGGAMVGVEDAFVVKFNSNGEKIWSRQFGKATATIAFSTVTADQDGNCYVGGTTDRLLAGANQMGRTDFFVSSYSPDGNQRWLRQSGIGGRSTIAVGIAVDERDIVTTSGSTLESNVNPITFIESVDANGNFVKSDTLWPEMNVKGLALIAAGNSMYIAGETKSSIGGQNASIAGESFIAKLSFDFSSTWTKILRHSKPEYYEYEAVTFDRDDNMILGGYAQGDFDGLKLDSTWYSFFFKYNSIGQRVWSAKIENSWVTDLKTDASGSVYAMGVATGILTAVPLSAARAPANATYVAKYSSSGTRLWLQTIGQNITYTQGHRLALDAIGNAYAAGVSGESLDGNSKVGGRDLFITKLSPSGEKIWTKQFGAVGATLTAAGIVLDEKGRLVIVGTTDKALSNKTMTGLKDIYLVKYNSNGDQVELNQYGIVGISLDAAEPGVDSRGNIFIAATSYSTSNKFSLVRKYAPTGELLWDKRIQCAQVDSVGGLYISSLAVSSGGEVAVTGSTTCALDIQPLQGDEDVFIAKFASNGKASPYYLIGAPSLSDGSKINTEAYFLAARGNSFIALGTTDGELPGSKKVGSDDAVFIQWTEE